MLQRQDNDLTTVVFQLLLHKHTTTVRRLRKMRTSVCGSALESGPLQQLLKLTTGSQLEQINATSVTSASRLLGGRHPKRCLTHMYRNVSTKVWLEGISSLPISIRFVSSLTEQRIRAQTADEELWRRDIFKCFKTLIHIIFYSPRILIHATTTLSQIHTCIDCSRPATFNVDQSSFFSILWKLCTGI